ncbi:hypothetical protein RF55_14764 [Lasius niger]|uniref:Uncharacterized protein n=1 Tax=Lasius niger TaxID=67767 RepID=A0A0J7K7P4_LASNI|nr:hypothetical protein RF55_14764 [Lasius niger]
MDFICRRTVTGLVTSKTCNKTKVVKTGMPVQQLTAQGQADSTESKAVRESRPNSGNPSRNASVQRPSPTYDNITGNASTASDDPPYHLSTPDSQPYQPTSTELQHQRPNSEKRNDASRSTVSPKN